MNIKHIGFGMALAVLGVVLSWSQQAQALALDKNTKVSVAVGNNLSVDLYAKYAGRGKPPSKDYYYAPSRVRISAGANNEPQLTILTYISDGSEGASGGTFNAMVTWDFTEAEKRKIAARLKKQVPGARLRGAVPLETAESGQSISVLVALGGEEKVAWSGRAPTQSGGRAAIAANLSNVGATLLDRGIQDGNLAGISVSMDYMIPFKADLGTCNVSINWDKLRVNYDYRAFSQHKQGYKFWFIGSDSKTVNDHSLMINYGQQNGMITNDCDYGRVSEEQVEFFENAISAFLAAKLGAKKEAEQAALDAEASDEDESEENKSGSDPKPKTDHYEYRYSKLLIESFSGTETFQITRAIEVAEPYGPIVGNVKEWITGYENSKGVQIKSVNLTTSEFSQVPVVFTLGSNAIDMFGSADGVQAQLNSVIVTLKKQRENGGEFSRSHTFTRSSVGKGELDRTFEYARGANADPLNYQYAVTWNYVGRKGKQGAYVTSDSGSHALEPDAQSVPLTFAVDATQLSDNRILGATAQVRHRFLGQDRTSYLNVIAGGESQSKEMLFVDQDTPNVAVRTIFTHQQHGEVATDWKPYSVPTNGSVMVFGIVPEALIDEEQGYIDNAKAAVSNAAERKLDDVLEEFGKL